MAVADPWVTPIAQALLACLCATLAEEPYTPVCRCYLRHSDGFPPMDACSCGCMVGDPPREGNGEAWVRIVRVQPEPQTTRTGAVTCASLLQIELQMGIYRCIEGTLDGVDLPDEEALTRDAEMFLRDFGAMRRAVLCCDALENFDPEIGEWTPIGPSADCGGGAMTVTLTRRP